MNTSEYETLERQIAEAKNRIIKAYEAGKKAEARMHYRVFVGLLKQRPPEVVMRMEEKMGLRRSK